MLDLALRDLKLISEMLHAVVRPLLLGTDHADEAALLTPKYNHGALLLMRK